LWQFDPYCAGSDEAEDRDDYTLPAVGDALSPLSIHRSEVPTIPERICRALRQEGETEGSYQGERDR
jgi:hypothetical protein